MAEDQKPPAFLPEEIWAPLAEQIAIAGRSLIDSEGRKVWARGSMEALPELVREAVSKWVTIEVTLDGYPQTPLVVPASLAKRIG